MKKCLISGSGFGKILILDDKLEVLWSLDSSPYNWIEVNQSALIDNDVLLAVRMKEASKVIRIKPNYEKNDDFSIVWQYDIPDGGENHTCQYLLDGGTFLVESYKSHIRLVELDEKGMVRKTIGSSENKIHGFDEELSKAHMYIRQGYKTKDNEYLLPHFRKKHTILLDENGEFVRKFPSGGFSARHDNNGNIVISGGDSNNIACYSKNGELIWLIDKNDIEDVELGFVAGIEILKNNNIVFCNWAGHGEIKGFAIQEINPVSKEVVWHMDKIEKPLVTSIQIIE